MTGRILNSNLRERLPKLLWRDFVFEKKVIGITSSHGSISVLVRTYSKQDGDNKRFRWIRTTTLLFLLGWSPLYLSFSYIKIFVLHQIPTYVLLFGFIKIPLGTSTTIFHRKIVFPFDFLRKCDGRPHQQPRTLPLL